MHRWLIKPLLFSVVPFCAGVSSVGAEELADREEYKTQADAPQAEDIEIDEGAYRILYIGDSITRHGPRDYLDWHIEAGMAASSEESDYAHLLAEKIRATMPGRKVDLYFHRGGGSGKALYRYNAIDEVRPVRPHLIVVQLGEHEKKEDGVEALRENYEKLITAFDEQTDPKPYVIATGVWSLSRPVTSSDGSRSYAGWSGVVEATMREVCEQHGVPFVSVSDVAMDPDAHGYGTHKGVQWHPNDIGHAGYAEGLFEAYQNLPTRQAR